MNVDKGQTTIAHPRQHVARHPLIIQTLGNHRDWVEFRRRHSREIVTRHTALFLTPSRTRSRLAILGLEQPVVLGLCNIVNFCILAHVAIDWSAVGAISEAAGSVLSAGSLIAAAVAVWREARRWREGREREEKDRQDRLIAEASLVFARVHRLDSGQSRVFIANDGDRSVFNLRLTPSGVERWLRRQDGESVAETVRLLRPGGEIYFDFEVLPGEENLVGVTIRYSDSYGVTWVRHDFNPPIREEDP